VWREAWKYDERAYRYCLHDIGHAWQALALFRTRYRCDSFAAGHFPDDEVAELCRLSMDEWPMLIVSLHGKSIPVREANTGKTVWLGGQATQLSKETIAHPLIDSIHFATKRSGSSRNSFAESAPIGSGEITLPSPASIGSQVWRGCWNAALGARLLGRQAIDVIGRSSRPSSPSPPSHFRLTLPAGVSFSCICMLTRVDRLQTRRLQVLAGACRVGTGEER